jgi:CRISPR type III-associated protein (TIGR04423 family)
MENNNVTSIPKGTYQGYLWYSDAKTPTIIDGEMEELNLSSVPIPFIVEGYLYDGDNEKSYSIKMVDGRYCAYCDTIPETNESPCETEDITYLPNRFGSDSGIEGLKFRRVWEKKQDPLCENMEVLVPTVDLFVGFKKKSYAG